MEYAVKIGNLCKIKKQMEKQKYIQHMLHSTPLSHALVSLH